MRDGGKGDIPRPLSVDMETFDKNFEVIFGKKQPRTLKDYIEQKEKNDAELPKVRSQTKDNADPNSDTTS
jgi:hypothetical protein